MTTCFDTQQQCRSKPFATRFPDEIGLPNQVFPGGGVLVAFECNCRSGNPGRKDVGINLVVIAILDGSVAIEPRSKFVVEPDSTDVHLSLGPIEVGIAKEGPVKAAQRPTLEGRDTAIDDPLIVVIGIGRGQPRRGAKVCHYSG